jgi:hypothetical protein
LWAVDQPAIDRFAIAGDEPPALRVQQVAARPSQNPPSQLKKPASGHWDAPVHGRSPTFAPLWHLLGHALVSKMTAEAVV